MEKKTKEQYGFVVYYMTVSGYETETIWCKSKKEAEKKVRELEENSSVADYEPLMRLV